MGGWGILQCSRLYPSIECMYNLISICRVKYLFYKRILLNYYNTYLMHYKLIH